MRKRPRGFPFVLLVLAGLFFASRAPAQSGSQATFFHNMAAQDRAHAADARQRAKEWEDMAAKAQARATAASGSLKESWKQIAKDDANSAKELNDEAETWEQKAGQLDARAEQAEKEAAAANQPAPASSTAANPNPPRTTEKPATGNASGANLANGGTAQNTSPVTGPSTNELSLEDVLGYWRSTTDPPFPFVILSEAGPNNPPTNELVAHTKGRIWKGRFSGNSSGPLVSLTYTPGVDEINHDIPLPARKAVHGKLVWRIEFQAQGDSIDPVLKGEWFPGEVKWRDDAPDGAIVVGDGAAREIELAPDYGIRVDELEQPTLGIKLASVQDYDSDANQVEALIKGQRFFPRVTLPAEMARKQGASLPVTFKGLSGSSSDRIELKALAQVGLRPVVYSTDEPVTVADCGVLEPPRAPRVMSLYWIAKLFGAQGGQCLNLNVSNGEKVELRYADTFIQVPVYETWVQRGLVRQREAVARLRSALQAVFVGPFDRAAKDAAHKRIRMLANYESIYGSDKLTDLHRFYVGELYFGDAMGPAIALMSDDQLANYYRDTLNGPHEQTDPNYLNPLVKAYLEGLTGKDLNPQAETAANNLVWTSDAERFLVLRALRSTSDQLAAKAVKTWVEQFAFGGYEGIAAATQGGQLYLIATGTDHHGERVRGWDRLFAAVNLASTAVLSFAGSEFAQELLATRNASRLGRGLEQESLLLGDISRGVERLDGNAVIPDLPKSLSAVEREELVIKTAAQLDDAGVEVNCAMRGKPEVPLTLVDAPGTAAEIPGRDVIEAYVQEIYGSEATFVGGWSDHEIMPPQTRETCQAMSANYLIYKQTGRMVTEASAQKAIIQIMKEQLRNPPRPGQRGVRTLANFKTANGYLDGFDQLAIRDYLRAYGAKVAEIDPSGNKNLKLRHIWSALEKGYGVRVIIGGFNERHAIVVDGVVVGTRGGRPAVKAVRLYDSNVGRLIEVPAENFNKLLARDVKKYGILSLVKFDSNAP